MTLVEIVVALVIGALVNEACDLSPWAARKLVHWAAYRQYAGLEYAAEMAEELTRYIDDRPGKLFKLLVALGFVAKALVTRRKADPVGVAQPDPRWQPTSPTLPYTGTREPWDDDITMSPSNSYHPHVKAVRQACNHVILDIHHAAAAVQLDSRTWQRCLRKLRRVSGDQRWKQIARHVKRLQEFSECCGYYEWGHSHSPMALDYGPHEDGRVPTVTTRDFYLAAVKLTRDNIRRLLPSDLAKLGPAADR